MKRKEEAPMVDSEKEEKFIEMRARGLSFDSISKELGISKPTLLKLNKEREVAISRMKYINLEALIEQYKLKKEARLESLAKVLEKVDSAIEEADFSKVPLEKLVEMKCKLTDRMKEEFSPTLTIEASALDIALDYDSSRGYKLQVD